MISTILFSPLFLFVRVEFLLVCPDENVGSAIEIAVRCIATHSDIKKNNLNIKFAFKVRLIFRLLSLSLFVFLCTLLGDYVIPFLFHRC